MKKHILIITAILLFAVVLSGSEVLFVRASDETVSIQVANSSINNAFTNILVLERKGGNVTLLLARLNNAGDLLAQAENAYANGNLATVSSKADSAALIAGQVNSDAVASLKNINGNSLNNLILTFSFSVGAIVVFLNILVLVWIRLKRTYRKKLLSSKPEVVAD